MCCAVPGGALYSGNVVRCCSTPSCSAWRIPMPKLVAASFLLHTIAGLTSTCLGQKNVCGGGNVANDPPRPSATITRLSALTGTRVSFFTPPN